MRTTKRRIFLRNGGLLVAGSCVLAPHRSPAAEIPTSDPAADLNLPWTADMNWGQVVDIRRIDGGGKYWDQRLAKAQRSLEAKGGGVVFFPAGEYAFEDFIRLGDGIVLRGAAPSIPRAHDAGYAPPAKLTFPQYVPLFSGDGAPIESAFKGIVLGDPAKASNCGVVDLSIDRGHIHFSEGEGHECGRKRIVFGCVLTNAAVADPDIRRSKKVEQPGWHRVISRHHAAIDVKSAENLLIANNRLPKSGQANFTLRDFLLEGSRGEPVKFDVEFDYDNRPGLYINHYCIGGAGGSGDDGTPETHPHGFRRGIVIRDNYIYNTGRMAIGFCGDGALCANNVIRFEKDVFRPTVTGDRVTKGSSTNDNRAIEARGWRWVIDGNDYIVDRNICADRSYRINDGEGIMHEDHCNSDIRDSRLTNNKGNSYLSIYKCGTIDGLHIEGNDISVPGKIADIYVVANRNSGSQPCRNVRILNNVTRSHGIQIAGDPGENNLVKGNQHIGGGGKLTNEARAKVEGNRGYGS